MEHPHAPLSKPDIMDQAPESFVPEWEIVAPLKEEEAEQYYHQLHSYFLYGEKVGEGVTQALYPLKYAPQRRGDESGADDQVLAVTGKTALHLLNGQIQQNRHLRATFLTRLKRVTAGLNELLVLQSDEPGSSMGTLAFAEDLIAFDQITDMASAGVSSHFPPARVERLRSTLQTLDAAQNSYAQGRLAFYTSEAIAQAFDLERIFDGVAIQVASGNACEQARIQSQKDVQEWVQTMAALRMGELMIEQKYEEQLHDAYFDRFDLTYISKEDLQYLSPTLVIEESRQILHQANDFLALLSNEGFVKVLGINYLEELFDLNKQDSSHGLELASLAICRRNSYVFQGGIDAPTRLDDAYQKGLAFPGPVFWNILMPGQQMEQDSTAYYALIAAAESRYFPRLEYETSDNHFVNRQVNLGHNPTPETSFTAYEQAIQSAGETALRDFNFTIADFLAMDTVRRAALAIIPATFQHPNLVPAADYFSPAKSTLIGKIPFIWLVDEHQQLQRAVVPLSWIQAGRDRLEYWSFLQSLAGIHQAQQQATSAEWEQAKNTEIAKLKATLEAQFAQERSTDLQAAVYRMLNGLLSQEQSLESVLMAMSQQEAPPVVEVPSQVASSAAEPTKEPKAEEPQEAPQPISNKVWVESDECTSCQDCIDALPAVFKYNENKQAYVHNPLGSTFAKIVTAAEKCPAACIHPGVPQNKEEAKLEQWVKRAEKFN